MIFIDTNVRRRKTVATENIASQYGFWLILGVKTRDVFLCCATIVVLLFIVLLSLFSLFYVYNEFLGFLHQGQPQFWGFLYVRICGFVLLFFAAIPLAQVWFSLLFLLASFTDFSTEVRPVFFFEAKAHVTCGINPSSKQTKLYQNNILGKAVTFSLSNQL